MIWLFPFKAFWFSPFGCIYDTILLLFLCISNFENLGSICFGVKRFFFFIVFFPRLWKFGVAKKKSCQSEFDWLGKTSFLGLKMFTLKGSIVKYLQYRENRKCFENQIKITFRVSCWRFQLSTMVVNVYNGWVQSCLK